MSFYPRGVTAEETQDSISESEPSSDQEDNNCTLPLPLVNCFELSDFNLHRNFIQNICQFCDHLSSYGSVGLRITLSHNSEGEAEETMADPSHYTHLHFTKDIESIAEKLQAVIRASRFQNESENYSRVRQKFRTEPTWNDVGLPLYITLVSYTLITKRSYPKANDSVLLCGRDSRFLLAKVLQMSGRNGKEAIWSPRNMKYG